MLEEVRQELAKQSWKPELTGVVRNILERYHNVATSTQMVLSKTHEEPHHETYTDTLVQLLMLGIAVKMDCLEATGAPLHKPSVDDLRKCIAEMHANPLGLREDDWSWP